MLVTYAKMNVFVPFFGDHHGYMPPQLKTKTKQVKPKSNISWFSSSNLFSKYAEQFWSWSTQQANSKS